MILLLGQASIGLIFLGACSYASKLSYNGEKEIFILWTSLVAVLSIAVAEWLWCRKCPFFIEKMVYFRVLSYLFAWRAFHAYRAMFM